MIDEHEIYQKQTFRNRSIILTANGPQNLSVPVIRQNGKNTLVSETKISYVENWLKDHQRAIESAYRNTPYYQYYSDGIFEILERNNESLFDLNWDLTQFLIDKIGLSVALKRATESPEISDNDYRRTFQPKLMSDFESHHYIQTFEERHGFHSNPSIIDLLFSEGPNSISILQESLKN